MPSENWKNKIIGRLLKNRVDAFWFNAVPNSGDMVTPFLLRRYGFTPVLTDPDDAELISCGSLMQRISPEFCGHILGTGFLNDGPEINLPNAKVLAVRGTSTRDRIHAHKTTCLGDPGLLMGDFLPTRCEKKFAVGIIPHYMEKNDPPLLDFLGKHPDAVLIDIQRRPLDVLKSIDECECILSSSLHGIIFADSLSMPNCWVSLSEFKPAKKYKFNDYYSAYGLETPDPIPLGVDEPISWIIKQTKSLPVGLLEQVKLGLKGAFVEFCRAMAAEQGIRQRNFEKPGTKG